MLHLVELFAKREVSVGPETTRLNEDWVRNDQRVLRGVEVEPLNEIVRSVR